MKIFINPHNTFGRGENGGKQHRLRFPPTTFLPKTNPEIQINNQISHKLKMPSVNAFNKSECSFSDIWNRMIDKAI